MFFILIEVVVEKKLSKKEQKAKEDAEFDALMAGVPLVEAPKEESK